MELFAHYGYNKTNIGDIANSCGMSPGNLYRYFRNKQSIGLFVVAEHFREEEGMVHCAQQLDGDAEARVRAVITSCVMHTVGKLRESPKIVELAEMICETEEGIAMVGEHISRCHERLATIVQDGIDSGEFKVKDAAVAARAVQMGTKFFVVPFAIARHGLDQVEEDLKITLDLLCAGLRGGD